MGIVCGDVGMPWALGAHAPALEMSQCMRVECVALTMAVARASAQAQASDCFAASANSLYSERSMPAVLGAKPLLGMTTFTRA